MRLFWNLNDNAITLKLETRAHVTKAVPLKSGQIEPFELQFHRDGIPELVTAGSTILLGVKPAGKFEGTYLTSTSAWTTPGSAAGYYTANLSTNTAAINTALAIDGNDANDVAAITGTIAELEFLPPAAALPTKSQTFTFTITNRVNQGSEGGPDDSTPYPSASLILSSRPAVTGLTGGGVTKLDGIATVGLANGACTMIRVPAVARLWELERIAVVSSSVAAASVITTATRHGLTSGDSVDIGGHTGSTPAIDGTRTVTVLSETTFSIPVTVTVAGTGGFVTAAENSAAGKVRPDDFHATTNACLWKSVL